MTTDDPKIGNSRRTISRLAKSLRDKTFRHSFMARQLKLFLAEQIRALRGDLTQQEFGEKIGKPQSVVSRLEKQADRQISVQTLIDIAERLDIAVIIRFVDFPTFFRYTEDYSDAAIVPSRYNQEVIDRLAAPTETSSRVIEASSRLISEWQRKPEAGNALGPEMPIEPQGGIQSVPEPRPVSQTNVVQLRPIEQPDSNRRGAEDGGQSRRRA